MTPHHEDLYKFGRRLCPWSRSCRRVRSGEGNADQLLAIVDVGTAVREGGVTPEHVAATSFFNRGQQLGAAEFFVALWSELRKDEFALIVPKPVAPGLLDGEDLAEHRFLSLGCGEGFPLSVAFGEVEVQVTFYLKKDAVEAFDVRFDTRELERFVNFLKSRYGAPVTETRDTFRRKDGGERLVQKVLWEDGKQRAVLTAQLEKRRASMLVSRGNFEEEIYRVR